MNKKRESPTRLVISATKFTATFSKIIFLGIKNMLEKENMNYSQVNIFQASELKNNTEEIILKDMR